MSIEKYECDNCGKEDLLEVMTRKETPYGGGVFCNNCTSYEVENASQRS